MVHEPLQLLPTRREMLQTLLETLSANTYFQPPGNLVMEYPCIRYKLDDEEAVYADNVPYRRTKKYQLTVIDRDPDSELREKVAGLPLCSFDRHYTADNLNHYVFTIYF